MTPERTEHFVLKEDGKIYWIENMPDSYYYVQNAQGWRAAVQSAISNAVEVSNQKVVHGELFDKYDCRLKTGVVYSLQCSVEKQVIPGIVNKPWFTALVTFSQPEREETQVEKAKQIIAAIFELTFTHKDGYTPKGYGNWELNKATDAMYAYIKTIQEDSNP